MSKKFKFDEKYNAAWFISNCNHTPGARKRYLYGKLLIDAGLKLHTEGLCFGERKETAHHFGHPEMGEIPMKKIKFYLAFENAYHCNDSGFSKTGAQILAP